MMRRTLLAVAASVLAAVFMGGAAHAAIWYVNGASPAATQTGAAWAQAFKTVQQGMNAAAPGDQVWVAKGNYVTTVDFRDGVALYGGFAGTETSLTQRSWTGNPTVLDGALPVVPYPYITSVVFITNCTDPRTRLDGFTVRNGTGWADQYVTLWYSYGGGIRVYNSRCTIANNLITENHMVAGYLTSWFSGGGIAVLNSPYAVTICDNVIKSNSASLDGGGIFCENSSPVIERNRIEENSTRFGGGGVSAINSRAVLKSNLIVKNYVETYGAGIHVDGRSSALSVLNNTIADNRSYMVAPAVQALASSTLLLANNIVSGNSAGVSVSLTRMTILSHNQVGQNLNLPDYEGCSPDAGSITSDPGFADTVSGLYHLRHVPLSACIDGGDNAYASTAEKDLYGLSRVRDGVVDMGCYESGSVPPVTTASILGTLGLSGWYLDAAVLVQLSAIDPTGPGAITSQWAYSATTSLWNQYVGPISYSRQGSNLLFFRSTDVEGNTEPVQSTLIKLDSAIPSLSVSSPAATVTSTVSPIAFSGTASDTASGILSVRWSNPAAGRAGTCTGTSSWSASVPLASGANNVTITATDKAGRTRSVTRAVLYSPPDTTPPTVPAPPAKGSASAPIVVTFSESIVQGPAFSSIKVETTTGKITNVLKSASPPSGNTLSLTATMSAGKVYKVTLPAGCVKDAAGNLFGGLTFNYTATK